MGDGIDDLIEEIVVDAYGDTSSSGRSARCSRTRPGSGGEPGQPLDPRCIDAWGHLGLCVWRQRRWEEPEAMLTARVWLDPTGPLDALACLEPVRARTRWTRS